MYFCRMESESEETPLDFPNASSQHKIVNPIATLKSSVPLFMSEVPSVDKQNFLTNSPVER